MKRNTFLKNLGFGTIAVATSETILSSCMKNMDMSVTPQIIIDSEFKTALEIPETINGTTALTAQSGQDTLMSSAKVNVLGYRNGLLGPTIRVQKGTSVSIPFQNKMAEHTNLHWHGSTCQHGRTPRPNGYAKRKFQFSICGQSTGWNKLVSPTFAPTYRKTSYTRFGRAFYCGKPRRKSLKLAEWKL
jgi:FtsP/CotA-like multicopper oxidase with cupredoxin domain